MDEKTFATWMIENWDKIASLTFSFLAFVTAIVAITISRKSNSIAEKALEVNEKEHKRNLLNDQKKGIIDVKVLLKIPNNTTYTESGTISGIQFKIVLQNQSEEKPYKPNLIVLYKKEVSDFEFIEIAKKGIYDYPDLFLELPPKSGPIVNFTSFKPKANKDKFTIHQSEFLIIVEDETGEKFESNKLSI
jgi:hypothetical protein